VKQTNLSIKIKRLLKRINFPKYLHRFGPKKFKLQDHLEALLLMEVCKSSLRRTEKISKLFDKNTPTYSVLCKSRKRIPIELWQRLLKITSGLSSGEVAIDGTGFSKTNPSFHYLKRIDGSNPKNFAKLSATMDLKNKKFLAMRIRTSPRHDMQDVKYLLKRSGKIKAFYGDKGYSAEWLYELCFWKEIQTFIPSKKNVRMRRFRKKQFENYSEDEYRQRSLIECGFSCIKRKYGGMVRAKKIQGLRAEIYCKGIAHNLELWSKRFSTEPISIIKIISSNNKNRDKYSEQTKSRQFDYWLSAASIC